MQYTHHTQEPAKKQRSGHVNRRQSAHSTHLTARAKQAHGLVLVLTADHAVRLGLTQRHLKSRPNDQTTTQSVRNRPCDVWPQLQGPCADGASESTRHRAGPHSPAKRMSKLLWRRCNCCNRLSTPNEGFGRHKKIEGREEGAGARVSELTTVPLASNGEPALDAPVTAAEDATCKPHHQITPPTHTTSTSETK